jgi:hypothetical protein
VAAIGDVNTNEIIGMYVNPFIGVTDFAEAVIALCKWTGGGTKNPFLIWEANGPGESFGQKIRKLGYSFVYYKEDVRAKTQKKQNRWGWDSTKGSNGTKCKLLWELDSALMESIKKEIDRHSAFLLVYDEQLINELESYVWFEGKADIGPSGEQTETSGARSAHGDRVIATGLVVLGMKGQPKAAMKLVQTYSLASVGGRIEERRQEEERKKQNRKYLL